MHREKSCIICWCVPLQQFISDSVQALACVKYASTLAVSLSSAAFAASPEKLTTIPANTQTRTRRSMQRQLILVIGCIDVLAYAAFCTGFAYCDGAVATLVLAGGGQLFTAIMSKYILKKQPSQSQVLGVRYNPSQARQHRPLACTLWDE
jgi:drug/metabolite transporter (DMT)-like permease